MKKNEIRLGNIITSQTFDGKVTFPWIISESDILEMYNKSNWDNYIGIELNENWIIKCGFKKGFRSGVNYYFPLPQISAEIHYEDRVISLYSREWHLFLDTKYVHQLQNLVYSLINRELEIDI